MAGLGTLQEIINLQHLPPQVTNTDPARKDTADRDQGLCPPTWSLFSWPGSVGQECHGSEQWEYCSSVTGTETAPPERVTV